jgi:hypothetical protein
MLKYPRTMHIEGSRIQSGDENLECVPFEVIRGCRLVVEEKLDGANSAISFTTHGKLQLQSRGHYLSGGPRERQFDLLKNWAATFAPQMNTVLADRYIMFGEWMYAKHTVFYDRLPHYFMEFAIYDTQSGVFLSTPRRYELNSRMNCPIVSIPVLEDGVFSDLESVIDLIRPSRYKSRNWKQVLRDLATERSLDPDEVMKQTNPSDLAEGLYIKVEDEDRVLERYKFVRADFKSSILDSETRWMDRPIVPNRLAPEVDLFACQA